MILFSSLPFAATPDYNVRTRLLAVKLLKVILPSVSEENFEEEKDIQVYLVYVVVLLSGPKITRKSCSKELPFLRALFPFSL